MNSASFDSWMAARNIEDVERDDPDGCLNCGSPNVAWIEGDYPSGVTGPNGEQEILRESGWKCGDCGAVEDKLGVSP